MIVNVHLSIKKAWLSKRILNNGRGGENRTPTRGFGDRGTTTILHPYGDLYGIRTRECMRERHVS